VAKKKPAKKPVWAQSPPTEKTPKGLGKAESYKTQHPSWRTHLVDMSGPFGWDQATVDLVLRRVVTKLHNYESMTFEQMEEAGCHDIAWERLSRDARARLEATNLADLDLYSVVITGRQRVLARRDVARLHILWWDPDHKACPSKKRHT
jgi:hypothetical protein